MANVEINGEQVSINGGEVLGRSGQIKLEGTGISRMHAVIERVGHGFVIRDLGSRNGTQVNGRHVDRQTLRNNDTIKIGSAILRFRSSPIVCLSDLLMPGRPVLETGDGTGLFSDEFTPRKAKGHVLETGTGTGLFSDEFTPRKAKGHVLETGTGTGLFSDEFKPRRAKSARQVVCV